MSSVKLSVVTATFNRRNVLERTLPTLLAQDLPPENYELIFVIDGSTDGTAEMLCGQKTTCALRLLEQPHRGPGAARNKGIYAARGDLVLFLDDDILCPPNLLSQHCAAHPSLDPIVVHGPIYVAPDSPQTLIRYSTEVWYEACYRRLDPAAGLKFPLNASSLINSSMPRELILKCGGFDEEAPSMEDLELGLRLAKMGTQFRYLPTAVAYELFMKSSGDYVQKQMRKSAQAEIYLCRRHPEYRPHSWLARMGQNAGWKKLLRSAAMRSPLSPAPLLTPFLRMAERLYQFTPLRHVGVRLLDVAATTTLHRAVFREVGSWRALQSEFGRGLPVLMYHHVGPPKAHTYAELTVVPEQFERQIRWLARRGYAGIRPTDWAEWLRTGKGLPDKPVLVTFDDGYADLAEHALPVLRRYRFGAVVFIVTGLVGGTNAWDEARGSAFHQLLTADQIRYWATQGIEFGAHSRTHTDLTALSSDELAKEIIGSRDELANLLGSPVTSFAYPYGSFNQMVNTCTREAYNLTFRADETTPGINYLCTDPHNLQRTMIHPGSGLLDLECRIRWGHYPILELRERLRLGSRLRRLASAVLGRKPPLPPESFLD